MLNRMLALSLVLVFTVMSLGKIATAQEDTDSGSRSLFAATGPSPSSGRISGTVRTVNGHEVANANIQARDVEHGSRQVSCRTDSQGSFALYNIQPGTYEITVTTESDAAHQRIQVSSTSGDTSVDFRLTDKLIGVPKTKSSSTVSLSQYLVPGKARSLYVKAAQSMQQGKLEEARKKVDAALALCPKFSEALTLRGMLQSTLGKEAEAIADLQQAIQYDSSYALAYIGLGSVLNSAGQFGNALPILGQAERLAPNTWQTHFELARAHIGRYEFADALRNIDRASELQGGPKKESPQLHLVRGYALVGLADISRATREIEAFLANEPRGRIADAARSVLDRLREPAMTATK